MGTLIDWISHRAGVVGLSWPQGVSEVSGVALATLDSVSRQDLRKIGRSARGYIARSLKVSVRELEALAAGRIAWIGDERIIDFDRLSPASGCGDATPRAIACDMSRGIPILGRILERGRVEQDDAWSPEDGGRLAVRYPDGPDAFSLELMVDAPPDRAGMCLVFQAIAPGEFHDGERAIITCGPVDAGSVFCVVDPDSEMSLRLLPATQCADEPKIVVTADILRAARVINARARTNSFQMG